MDEIEDSPLPLGRFTRKPRGLKTYNVTLIKSEVEAFDAIAKAQGKTRSELLRDLMRAAIDAHPAPAEGVRPTGPTGQFSESSASEVEEHG